MQNIYGAPFNPLALALGIVMMARFRERWGATRRPEFSDLPMIGLVLVTHGRLAVEFRAALEHVVGEQQQIETVTIGPDDDVEQRRRDIIEAVKRADHGDGVVILTDMFGGTPSNLSISVMNRPNVEVVAGINLPMLVKLAKVRAECPLDKSVAAAQEAGKKYITVASRVLAGK
jgi:mannose PTS system EIIA component